MSKKQRFIQNQSQSKTFINQDEHLSSSHMLRQEIMQKGVSSLDDAALISLIIDSNYLMNDESLTLAQRVLHGLGSLDNLLTTNLDELCMIKGIGPAKASRLLVAVELMKRAHLVKQTGQYLPSYEVIKPFNQLLIEQVRLTCNETTPLIMACALERSHTETPQYMIERAMESAYTLSLSADLGDIGEHSRWLAKLLLHNPMAHWLIISLREHDQLSASETEGTIHFVELALAMNVILDQILVLSPTQDWTVFNSEGTKL